MTAVAPPVAGPAEIPHAARHNRRRTPSARADGRGPSLLLAELALVAATVAALVPYTQVFTGGDLFPTLVVAALASHLLAAILRRRRAPFWLLVPALAIGFVLVGTWTTFADTTSALLPTPETARALVDALSASLERAEQDAVPVPADPGFVVVTFAATWLSAAVADRAAFRWWLVLQALVPAAALFTVGAVLSPQEATGRATIGATFLVAALLFVLFQRPLVAAHRLRWTWSAGGARAGRRRQLATGVALLALVGAVASLSVPPLPGGDAEGIYDWRPGGGAPPRSTVSPLIDIRSRLVDQSDAVLFTVVASQPAYWRTTGLDVFDGSIWKSNGNFGGADGQLDLPEAEAIGSTRIEQRFELDNPGQIWLPAAFRPVAVDAGDTGVRFDEESGTLIVDSDRETSDGLDYSVVSAPPDLDPAVLEAAAGPPPPAVAERYVELPDDFSTAVVDLARAVTAGAATPYQQALALQSFFLDGSFRYSLDVADSHSSAAIEDFLERRTGYCEQFAGTYAAMARAVGLPSRVAVGYMAGDVDPADAQRYLVRGEDAHAWPEVWLTGVGWIPMEPTPSDPDDTPTATTTTTTTPSTNSSTPPAGAAGSSTTTSINSPELGPGSAEPADDVLEPVTRALGDAGPPLLGFVLLAAGVLVLGLLGGWRIRQLRRRGDPEDRVQATWALLIEDLRAAGLRVEVSDTPMDVARRARALDLVDPQVLDELAASVTAARWAPGGVADDEDAQSSADHVADLGELVEEAVDGRLDARRRWARRLDVRLLWWHPEGDA
jgi:transglutaminase-like putative cysteine protease